MGAAPPLEGFHAHPKGVLQFHFDHRDTVAVGQTSGSAPISRHIAPLWLHQSGRRGKNEDVRAAPSAAPSDARSGLLQERPPGQTADALDDPGALPCVLCRTRRAPLFWATQNGATEFGTLSASSSPSLDKCFPRAPMGLLRVRHHHPAGCSPSPTPLRDIFPPLLRCPLTYTSPPPSGRAQA